MRQYAKHRGVSPEAVSKAVKTGRLSTVTDEKGNRKIDPVVADREWFSNRDESYIRNTPMTNEELAPPAAPEEPDKPKGPNYAQHRAIREAFAARLAKLEYEEKTGRLVDGEEIRKLWVTVASIVRTKVLGIPSKIRQQIPETTGEQYVIIEKIVREALEDLARNESGVENSESD